MFGFLSQPGVACGNIVPQSSGRLFFLIANIGQGKDVYRVHVYMSTFHCNPLKTDSVSINVTKSGRNFDYSLMSTN